MGIEDICFMDGETTGLDPVRHEVWSLALRWHGVNRMGLGAEVEPGVFEFSVMFGVHQAQADMMAMMINKFYEHAGPAPWDLDVGSAAYPDGTTADRRIALAQIATLTSRKHIAGAVPSFDTIRVENMLRGAGLAPAWHYHLIDVETLCAGALGWEPPYNSKDLTEAMGVETDEESKHTAVGDVRWADALYQAWRTMGPAGVAPGP